MKKINKMKKINIPLSSDDIMKLMNGKTKILKYGDLKNYKTIEDVIKPYNNCVLLYESILNVGHWILIHLDPKGRIEVFDSYGEKPDDQLKWIDDDFRVKSGQLIPHLTYLLYKTPKEVEYNNYKFQKYDPDIATCGRHCIMRYYLRDLDIDKYKDYMDKLLKKNKMNSFDKLVSKLI